MKPFFLLLLALIPLGTCLKAEAPPKFNGKTALEWSIALGDSEVRRVGTSMSAPKGKWDYANFLYLNSLLKVDETLGKVRYQPFVQATADSFVSPDGKTIQAYKVEEANIDNIAPGRALLSLAKKSSDRRYLAAAGLLRKQLETHPRTSEGPSFFLTRITGAPNSNLLGRIKPFWSRS